MESKKRKLNRKSKNEVCWCCNHVIINNVESIRPNKQTNKNIWLNINKYLKHDSLKTT